MNITLTQKQFADFTAQFNLKFKKQVITSTRTTALNQTNKLVTFPLTSQNKDFIKFLSTKKLSNDNLKNIKNFLKELSIPLKDQKVKSVKELANKLSHLNGSKEAPIKFKLYDRYYPAKITTDYYTSFFGPIFSLSVNANLGCNFINPRFSFYDDDLVDSSGNYKTVEEILREKSIEFTTDEDIKEQARKSKKLVNLFTNEVNKLFTSNGLGLQFHAYKGLTSFKLNERVIIEHELDVENQYGEQLNTHEYSDPNMFYLPLIRVFSFKHKAYMYIDVDDITEYEYCDSNIDKLVLPTKMLNALKSVMEADNTKIFGDLFKGRHGGIVIMANGASGIGKTLSAEVFAEYQKRPLYSIEMAELGTTAKEVEHSLRSIFS